MCEVGKCRNQDISVIYYGHEVCEKHFQMHCAGKINLKKKLGVEND